MSTSTLELSGEMEEAIKASFQKASTKRIVEEFFLESLEFTSMYDREEDIQAAHKATFDWIFDFQGHSKPDQGLVKSKDSFIDWIQGKNESNIYWINGEPGCGKSTLMRFLYDHPKTKDELSVWADSHPLLFVRYFLWTSGTTEQRSHTGLLRAILHQLLQNMKDVIPWAFPALWLKYLDSKTRAVIPIQWSIEEMMSALHKALAFAKGKWKICFFIDGLDELEGDQAAMIEMVKGIVQSSPIDFRACVSSRSWKIFEEAFKSVPQLKLQELTLDGIAKFVNERLNEVPKLRRILAKEPTEAAAFEAKIVTCSKGVFLWATLGVQAIVERTHEENNVKDAVHILDLLPLKLEELFKYLLFDSKSDEDLQYQARIFHMIRSREIVCEYTRDESSATMNLYQLTLAELGESVPLENEIKKPTNDWIMELCQSTKDRLATTCAGFLLATPNARQGANNSFTTAVKFGNTGGLKPEVLARSRISYLHRTVRDFLVFSGGLDLVTQKTETTFDPHVAMLRSHILQLRLPLEEPEQHRRLDEWWSDVVLAMTHARYVKDTTQEIDVSLLNTFKSTLDWYWRTKTSDPLDNWARNAFASYEERMKYRTPYHYPFHSLAAKFGLAHYLESELSNKRYEYIAGIPILSHAIEFLVDRRKTVYPLSTPGLVSVLFQNNQNPNQVYQTLKNADETPWLLALKYVREADRRLWILDDESNPDGIERWIEILRLFLNNGAYPNALIVKDYDPAATALDVIEMIAKKHQSIYIKAFLEELIQKGATSRAADCEDK
jgi:hypothetical protein